MLLGTQSSCFRLNFSPLLFGWLPYVRRPCCCCFFSRLRLAPSWMSIRGGVENPKPLATLTKSSLCTSNTDRSECEAYAWRYDRYPSLAD